MPLQLCLGHVLQRNVNVSSFGGWRSNTKDDARRAAAPAAAAPLACGTYPVGYSQMNIQAARWHYINDWTCLGATTSASVSDTSASFAWGIRLYLYPALIPATATRSPPPGLSGKTPAASATATQQRQHVDFKASQCLRQR